VTVAATNGLLRQELVSLRQLPGQSVLRQLLHTEFDKRQPRRPGTDGPPPPMPGLTWGAPTPTADKHPRPSAGNPSYSPTAASVVPFEGLGGQQRYPAPSPPTTEGATWNASVRISTRSSHAVPGRAPPPPLPSAEISRDGHRLRSSGKTNPLSNPAAPPTTSCSATSADGTTWSPGQPDPPSTPVGSNVDHFIPGLAVDRTTTGGHTLLALTYYFEQPARLAFGATMPDPGPAFTSSLDNGAKHGAHRPRSVTQCKLGWIRPHHPRCNGRRLHPPPRFLGRPSSASSQPSRSALQPAGGLFNETDVRRTGEAPKAA